MPQDTKLIIKRVTKYGRKPTTPTQALVQAHAFLREEGQFVTGEFFEDGDAKEAYEKASCSSWSACSMGAIGLVTGEMTVSVTKTWEELDDDDKLGIWQEEVSYGQTEAGFTDWCNSHDFGDEEDAEYEFSLQENFSPEYSPISWAAAERLSAAIEERDVRQAGESPLYHVVRFNDATGRTEVLRAFEAAIVANGGKVLAE